jgi:di/tricarboxylate transporter
MGNATGFLWLAVVILALAWALQVTGTVRLGIDLGFWLPVLLGVALLGALFSLFVTPFIGRSRTTRTATMASGTTTAGGDVESPRRPVAGTQQEEVVQETRDRPSL